MATSREDRGLAVWLLGLAIALLLIGGWATQARTETLRRNLSAQASTSLPDPSSFIVGYYDIGEPSIAPGEPGYTLFGGFIDSMGNAIDVPADHAFLVSPGHNSRFAVNQTSNAGPPITYAGINYTIPSGLTVSDITSLSTDYMFTVGSCGGGAPRFQINVDDPTNGVVNIQVYIGPPPNYTLCPPDVWSNTGNLLSPSSTVDTTQLPGGTPYDAWADAVAKYGTEPVVGIQLVTDAGWFFTSPPQQTVVIDNTDVNGQFYTYESQFNGSGIGDNLLQLINPTAANGSVCAFIYVFDNDEEMGECCGCPVSPNGIDRISVVNDLTDNWGITSFNQDSGVIDIITGLPNSAVFVSSLGISVPSCDPGATATGIGNLIGYITHNQAVSRGTQDPAVGLVTTGTTTSLTEVSLFDEGAADSVEAGQLINTCAFLQVDATHKGQCSCGFVDYGNALPVPLPLVAPTG